MHHSILKFSLLFCSFYSSIGLTVNEIYLDGSYVGGNETYSQIVYSDEVYLLRLRGLNSQDGESFEHSGAVSHYPDLPQWNFLRPFKEDLLLYGSYPEAAIIPLQVVSTNQRTFETSLYQLQLQVESNAKGKFKHEIELKISNHNVEDVFDTALLVRLERVVQNLWRCDPPVRISKLASVLDIGGRKPIDPRHKEGFVVRFAAQQEVSFELRTVEMEVRQLRNRIPCPRDYKRTSVEWRFREIGVIIDWCGFQLLTKTEEKQEQNIATVDPAFRVIPPVFDGPSLEDLPRRSSLQDILISLIIPLIVSAVLLTGLSGMSLCLYSNENDKKN